MFSRAPTRYNTIAERFRWFVTRRKLESFHRYSSRRRSLGSVFQFKRGSQLMRSLRKGGSYEWSLKLSPENQNSRPQSIIIPKRYGGYGGYGGFESESHGTGENSVEKVVVVESTVSKPLTALSADVRPNGVAKLAELERKMLLDEVKEIRLKSRQSAMEPISEEKDLAFSNEVYGNLAVNPTQTDAEYENVMVSDTNPTAAEYENVGTDGARLFPLHSHDERELYENVGVEPEQYYQNIVRSKKFCAKSVPCTYEPDSGYENYDFGENGPYQMVDFGKAKQSNDKEDMNGLEKFIKRIEEVNQLVHNKNAKTADEYAKVDENSKIVHLKRGNNAENLNKPTNQIHQQQNVSGHKFKSPNLSSREKIHGKNVAQAAKSYNEPKTNTGTPPKIFKELLDSQLAENRQLTHESSVKKQPVVQSLGNRLFVEERNNRSNETVKSKPGEQKKPVYLRKPVIPTKFSLVHPWNSGSRKEDPTVFTDHEKIIVADFLAQVKTELSATASSSQRESLC